MRQTARVTSIDALKDFKRALDQFMTVAATALGEAASHVQRTTWWIENEQTTYWKAEQRKRGARLAEAKNELFRAQLEAQQTQASAVLERRRVDKCQAAFDEAVTKLANIKRWRRILERESILYKGATQQLGRALEGDCPVALAKLDKMVDALERYVHLPAPVMEEEAPVETEPPREEETP